MVHTIIITWEYTQCKMEKVCSFNHAKNINISQVNIQIIFRSKGKNTLKMAVNHSLFQHLVHNQL